MARGFFSQSLVYFLAWLFFHDNQKQKKEDDMAMAFCGRHKQSFPCRLCELDELNISQDKTPNAKFMEAVLEDELGELNKKSKETTSVSEEEAEMARETAWFLQPQLFDDVDYGERATEKIFTELIEEELRDMENEAESERAPE